MAGLRRHKDNMLDRWWEQPLLGHTVKFCSMGSASAAVDIVYVL